MTKILVVEDEPGIALGLEDDLRLEGWDVELVADGAIASRRARNSSSISSCSMSCFPTRMDSMCAGNCDEPACGRRSSC